MASHEQAESFIEAPAFQVSPGLLSDFGSKTDEGRRLGPYKIVGEIGQGGMGRVYLAERADDAYKKRVAIKLVLKQARMSSTRTNRKSKEMA